MLKLIIWMAGWLLVYAPARAQETERMETDRPDQTECPFIVPVKWVQLEAGFNYEKLAPGAHNFVYPTLLSKYGISKRLELRVITSLLYNRQFTGMRYEEIRGIEPVQLGAKLALWEEKKWLPKTSLIAHVAIPQFASSKLHAEKMAPDFVFTLQHTITSSISLGYNLGAAWDGFSTIPAWIYRVSPGFNLGKKSYVYAEAFGFIQKNETANHMIDGGFAYYLHPDLKLDVSAGKGLSAASLSWYIALGISSRFHL